EQRIAVAREAELGRESSMSELRVAIDASQERETALVAELTACRVDAAAAAERVDALGRELGRLDEMETDLGLRLEQGRARGGQLESRRAWLVEERERTDGAARDVAAERDRAEADAHRAGQEHEGLLAELRALDNELRGEEAELRRLVESVHE